MLRQAGQKNKEFTRLVLLAVIAPGGSASGLIAFY